MKVWRHLFIEAVTALGEEQAAAIVVGITTRRVRQLKAADPRFRSQVLAAREAYARRFEQEVRAELSRAV